MRGRERSGQRRLFCFGLGYVAAALAKAVRAEGWEVAGTCRGGETRRDLAAAGVEVYRFDGRRPLVGGGDALEATSHLLVSIPPDAGGDPVLAQNPGLLGRLGKLSWLGYLSSTAVYGDRGGSWVDEETTPEPSGERGRRRLAAEEDWVRLARQGLPVHVFRLAGIYGPGRSPLDRVRAGSAQRIHKPGHLFSRIHVADIVRTLRASIERPRPCAVYNVADDLPAPSAEVIAFACRLLGVEPPPLVPYSEAELSPAARGFWRDSRRVANRRIKDELGVELLYPTYREGLRALAGLASGRRDAGAPASEANAP